MKKQVGIIGLMLVLIIVGSSGCINEPKESTQFSIVSFDVEPGIINQGESANLSWTVISASSVNIDNRIGSVALSGYRIIQPTQTTSYILTASNATITKNATVTITVNNESTQPEKTLLTISVGSQSYNYTLDDLTTLNNISGQGSYINKAGKITGPNTYTGVTINVLLSTLSSLPTNFTFQAIASDQYVRNYTLNEVNGHVILFNETGAEIGTGNLTMIIAYKENGVFLNETTKGPLRIAFIDTQPSLTNSGLWLSSLNKIEITNQSPNTQPDETLLTITVGSKSYNYTLNNLTSLGIITGQGSYINKAKKITGPNNYTGVSINVLLNSIPTLPNNYTVQAIASDEYSLNYTMDEVNGHVIVLNEKAERIGMENLTMIVAYKENGDFLNETTKGPLQIAFIDTQPTITYSGLWLSSLIKIEIIQN